LDERPVELRSAIAEEIELVLTGDDVVLVARAFEVDVGDEEPLLGAVGFGEPDAVRIDDLAPAAELARALLADAVRVRR
jgi:hypothetical protein